MVYTIRTYPTNIQPEPIVVFRLIRENSTGTSNEIPVLHCVVKMDRLLSARDGAGTQPTSASASAMASV